jgi:hypothetical protein
MGCGCGGRTYAPRRSSTTMTRSPVSQHAPTTQQPPTSQARVVYSAALAERRAATQQPVRRQV